MVIDNLTVAASAAFRPGDTAGCSMLLLRLDVPLPDGATSGTFCGGGTRLSLYESDPALLSKLQQNEGSEPYLVSP